MGVDFKAIVVVALVAFVLWLGRQTHDRSLQREPIVGGGVARFFNFLSGLCFVAILPTVCVSVLFLHPAALDVAGFTFHPLVLIVLGLAALSLLSAFLFALVEKAPAERVRREQARNETLGWTEEDAKSSGL